MIIVELPMLPAGVGHELPVGELGSFYDWSEPVVVICLDAATHEVIYPHVKQRNTGIQLSFDALFNGGKAKLLFAG